MKGKRKVGGEKMVRSYQVYWIENEFADYFYGRERTFYNLFSQLENAKGSLHTIINTQVNYITKPIPFLPTKRMIEQGLSKKDSIKPKDNEMIVEESSCGAKIVITERCIKLDVWGTKDWESFFFEILRKSDQKLLAIDLKNERFGWLKPIKQRKYIY
jgi:hypothetical protein